MTLMIRTATAFALTATLIGGGTTALAHGDETHADTLKATQGGQLGVAGAYSYELVISKDAKETADSAVVVYVTDHAGKKVSTSGATGSATILVAKQKYALSLQPDGDNRMKGMGKYSAAADMKVLVSVTLQGKAAEQTRFTPLAPAKDGHTDHSH